MNEIQTHTDESRSRSALQDALAGDHKGQYVSRMFGRIAARYDLLNRLMSLGHDQSWRRRMAELADLSSGATVLDLATGTGDVGLAILQGHADARVIGADFALPMMQVGQAKLRAGASLDFVGADALVLPFEEECFDAVLHAFLMRNIEDIQRGFQEQWRVLRPGGRVVCLEIVGPSAPMIRSAYSLFFETLVPRIGSILSGDRDAYSYLPQSVLRFPSPDTLSRMMEEAGFVRVRYERVMLGSVAIHSGVKPAA